MKHIFILFIALFIAGSMRAQLEKVIVETYYISDSTEAKDTIHGLLEAGSTTYRIYADLQPGAKLMKIFGSSSNNLKISSDAVFFNNLENGVSFGKDAAKNDLNSNTVALDTWLTLGQVAKKSATIYTGVLKTQDKNGSFLGGTSNDSSYLSNTNPLAGIPVTIADGLATQSISGNWVSDGILDANGDDSTIFGSLLPGKAFNSNGRDVFFANGNGVTGVIPDSNQVLIAQLTTKGKIAFELNLAVQDANGKTIYYVAKGKDHITSDSIVKVSPFLTYPTSCGCRDPHYLEYNNTFACDNVSECKTRIVCGCTDKQACNYDSNANVNVPALCCYPGYCNNRDIAVVCPALSSAIEFTLFPNPSEFEVTLQISGGKEDKEVKYAIYDSFGILKLEKNIHASGTVIEQVDVSQFTRGMYWIRVSTGGTTINKLFMKK